MTTTSRHVIGTGRLTWSRSERMSDRYGFVKLVDGDPPEQTELPLTIAATGTVGRLVATVLTARNPYHIGDFFHGVFPVKPDVGEVIVLGHGRLAKDGNAVGLEPDDGRETLWLDIRALYRAHDQTVELAFVPDPVQ